MNSSSSEPSHFLKVREALPRDVAAMEKLIAFAFYLHRHLDWRLPLEWIGKSPFLVLEQEKNLDGLLALPPEPAGIHWVRSFAVSMHLPPAIGWGWLWEAALEELRKQQDAPLVAVLAIHPWMADLVKTSGFSWLFNIVGLEWRGHLPEKITSLPAEIRTAQREDLPAIVEIDKAAFHPLWQLPLEPLQLAYDLASYTRLIMDQGRVVGYQLSTVQSQTAHLARLAILPEYQRQSYGRALVQDMLAHFMSEGMRTISVNTQSNNSASLALYQQLGFVLNGEEFPIYSYQV